MQSHQVNWKAGMALAGFLFATGCGQDAVSSYEIPKEDYTPRLASAPAGDMGHGGSREHIHWVTPASWKEKPADSMRVASFEIVGDDGKKAEVRITPLPATAEMEAGTVSMWQSEMGLTPAAPGTVAPQATEAAGMKARLYDFTSEEPKYDGKHKARLIAAILPRQGTMWFIRMSGEESLVSRERDTFHSFLKSLTFDSGSHEAEGRETSRANWKIPEHWQNQTAGPMVKAAFGVEGADITVSSLTGEGGGLLGNVNRWRGQFGLPPITALELEKEVKQIELADTAKAFVVDITGTNPKTKLPGRLYGLIVPRGGETWFYKMTGDTKAVAAETTHLAEFAATAH